MTEKIFDNLFVTSCDGVDELAEKLNSLMSSKRITVFVMDFVKASADDEQQKRIDAYADEGMVRLVATDSDELSGLVHSFYSDSKLRRECVFSEYSTICAAKGKGGTLLTDNKHLSAIAGKMGVATINTEEIIKLLHYQQSDEAVERDFYYDNDTEQICCYEERFMENATSTQESNFVKINPMSYSDENGANKYLSNLL
ncbi:MAG: hypothetical protein K5854_08885 [Prevotella sp.]|nr:hypothetical protein [Prevotella sp.]